MVEIGGS